MLTRVPCSPATATSQKMVLQAESGVERLAAIGESLDQKSLYCIKQAALRGCFSALLI